VTPNDLVHEWNDAAGAWSARRVEVNDESLRDGLQCPSVVDPRIEVKCELVDAMGEMGIEAVNIGFPASSDRTYQHAVALGRHIARTGLRMSCNAARTKLEDIAAVARVAQACGVEVGAFVAASPLRQVGAAFRALPATCVPASGTARAGPTVRQPGTMGGRDPAASPTPPCTLHRLPRAVRFSAPGPRRSRKYGRSLDLPRLRTLRRAGACHRESACPDPG
jgi:hypothetical protein